MSVFCAFLDVMGVQNKLTPVAKDSHAVRRFNECHQILCKFHRDIQSTATDLSFVAEFSDSVYFVSDRLVTVAKVSIMMIRLSLINGYPLRGGIGCGTFSHEFTGVSAYPGKTIWSNCSFMGGAIVSAYQASDLNNTPGLRVLVHPAVMRRNTEAYLKTLTVPLEPEQQSETASHELRCFGPSETPLAIELLKKLEYAQDIISDRARRHYAATVNSIQHMSDFKKNYMFSDPPLKNSQVMRP